MTSREMFVWEDEIVNGTHFFDLLIQLFRSAAEYVYKLPTFNKQIN